MKVFIIAAITADGCIAKHADHAADWTTPEDKKLFVQLTKEAGVMVFGSTTFATIGRALPDRRTIIYTSRPDAITTDGVETTNETPEALLSRLQSEGVSGVAICGGSAIYTLFAKSGLVDEMYLSVEPVLFGQGIGLFNEAFDLNMQLHETRKLNDSTVLLHYRVNK